MNTETTKIQVHIDTETLEVFDRGLLLLKEAVTLGETFLAREIQNTLEAIETSIALSALEQYRKQKAQQ